MPTPVEPANATAHPDLLVPSRTEITAILEELRDKGTPINLTSPSEAGIPTQIWTVDPATETLSFRADPDQPLLQSLIDSNEATAAAYLDSVKIQFELQDLMLVRGTQGCALHGRFPTEMLRFQRRNNYRVQPLSRTLPRAHFRHPMLADIQLELRVLDISLGGCALFLPSDIPTIQPGILLNDVRFLLDSSTRFVASVFLHHITSLGQTAEGVRLGCEIMKLDAESQRVLQRYIDQNQKQRRLQQKR